MSEEIRNSDGIWINSSYFSEEAKNFLKNGYYIPDPYGSQGWKDYWEEQLNRCINGYSVGGAKITGHHYAYLNFTRIKRIDFKTEKKVVSFPDFWDGDYNFFWALDIARKGIEKSEYEKLRLNIKISDENLAGNKHMIIAKARRRGYSFKIASIVANTYNTVRNSLCLIGAYESKYANDTMDKTLKMLNFYNEHTGFKKNRDVVNRNDYVRASYLENQNGMYIEKGYMSEISRVIYKDNPDAGRGKDAYYSIIDEAGVFGAPGLLKSVVEVSKPSLEAGKYVTGQLILFGTSGDMESGTIDFSDMYREPELYGFMPFVNIWDKDSETEQVGFFHPEYWNKEGYYDSQGNSNIVEAINSELAIRNNIYNKSKSSDMINRRAAEHALNPTEAFAIHSKNDFPVKELQNRLSEVLSTKIYLKKGQPVILSRDKDGVLIVQPDLKNETNPLYEFKPYDDNTGCPIIWEQPMPNAPKGLYIIGYDPYRQDIGTSLGAALVYKTSKVLTPTHDTIVAEYVGRPSTFDEYNRVLILLAEYYNATIMYENEVPDVKTYFAMHRKLDMLEAQPDDAIKNVIANSKVKRVYGMHMTSSLLSAAEKYTKSWLLEERDFIDGRGVTNIETIISPAFLQELIRYNRRLNTDRVSAFFMIMFYLSQQHIVYGSSLNYEANKTIDQLKEMIENLRKI